MVAIEAESDAGHGRSASKGLRTMSTGASDLCATSESWCTRLICLVCGWHTGRTQNAPTHISTCIKLHEHIHRLPQRTLAMHNTALLSSGTLSIRPDNSA